mgnify:CR=1 FL=1
MADLINLRLARKARDRVAAAERAAENRARHGQSGQQRRQQQAEAERADRALLGHQRDKS